VEDARVINDNSYVFLKGKLGRWDKMGRLTKRFFAVYFYPDGQNYDES
jgi:hypothetical protein